MPGAGKSTVASMAEGLGIPVATMGDAVRMELRRRGMEATPSNFDSLTRGLREEAGEAAVAKLTLLLIRERGLEEGPLLVIDGVRSLPEVKEMAAWPFVESITVMAVLSPFKSRFERLFGRGRMGDPKVEEELRRRDAVELSVGLGSVIALADIFLVNDGDLNDFLENAREKLTKWKEGRV